MADEPRPYDLPRSPALRALHDRYVGDDPERVAAMQAAMDEAREEQRAYDAREAALAALREAAANGDNEAAHGAADDALLAFLRAIGHGDVADAWEAAGVGCGGFWYA